MLSRIAVASLLAASTLGGQASGTPFDPPKQTTLSAAVVDVPLIKIGDFYFIDVAINGTPLRFTLETGAGFSAITGRAAAALGLPVDTITLSSGPQGGPTPVARIATLTMGGATLSGVSARVTSMFDGMGFDGIISLPALHDVLATIDLNGRRLRLERGELPAPNGRDIVPFSAQDRGRRVDIPVQVGGVTFAAVIDTRSFIGIILPDSTAAQLRLDGAPRAAGNAMGPSLGTFQLSEAALEGDMRIGGHTIRQPSLVFRNRPGVVIGVPLLEQLVLTIDQRLQRVRVARTGGTPIVLTPLAMPTRQAAAAPPPPAPGLRTMGFNLAGAPGGSPNVVNVTPGSDAEKVGLSNGDQLVEFDGTAATAMNPTVFRAAIARGSAVKVIVARDGRRLEFTVQPYLTPASTPAPPTTSSAIDPELAKLDSLWARSYAANDTSLAIQLMSANFAMWSANGATKDKAAELGDIRPAPGLTMRYFRTSGVETRRVGSLGVVTGVADWAFDMGGSTRTAQRRYTATYKKGGPLGWELAALQMSMAPAPADADLRRKVEALCATMVDAFKRDPASVSRFYTDDAKIIGGGQRYAGRREIDQYWVGATGFAGWSLEVLEVGSDAHGPWAIGRSSLTGPSGRTMTTNFIGLLRSSADGQLRFTLDLFAAAPPP